jgi:hypothetical protein
LKLEPNSFTFDLMLSLTLPTRPFLGALRRTFFWLCVAITLSFISVPSCSTLEGWFGKSVPTPAQVTSDTAGVVTATRAVVLLAGPTAYATLNAYIVAVHTAAQGIANGIQSGQTVLPTAAALQTWLSGIAAKYGNPVWMTNMIGNLVTEYTRFYNNISKDSVTAYNYFSAFAAGTV